MQVHWPVSTETAPRFARKYILLVAAIGNIDANFMHSGYFVNLLET